jgi:hypothetical protein
VPTAAEMKKINREPEIVEINKLVVEWKRRTKSQQSQKRTK